MYHIHIECISVEIGNTGCIGTAWTREMSCSGHKSISADTAARHAATQVSHIVFINHEALDHLASMQVHRINNDWPGYVIGRCSGLFV